MILHPDKLNTIHLSETFLSLEKLRGRVIAADVGNKCQLCYWRQNTYDKDCLRLLLVRQEHKTVKAVGSNINYKHYSNDSSLFCMFMRILSDNISYALCTEMTINKNLNKIIWRLYWCGCVSTLNTSAYFWFIYFLSGVTLISLRGKLFAGERNARILFCMKMLLCVAIPITCHHTKHSFRNSVLLCHLQRQNNSSARFNMSRQRCKIQWAYDMHESGG